MEFVVCYMAIVFTLWAIILTIAVIRLYDRQ